MYKTGWLAIILAAAMVFLAPSCQPPDNYAPIINSLEADAEWTLPSGSLNVTCDASDRDGDQLSYNWSASGGNISGTGPRVIWTAPEEIGVYDITIVVSDGRGGSDTESVVLIAATGTLSMIDNVIVTAEHKYLKQVPPDYYKVAKEQEYHIECIASSNSSDELIYKWLCTGGEILEEGSLITWTAPDKSGEVTMTVVVFDMAGNMDKQSIYLNVVSCSSCEFG